MPPVNRFENLIAWQKARVLAWRFEREFGLSDSYLGRRALRVGTFASRLPPAAKCVGRAPGVQPEPEPSKRLCVWGREGAERQSNERHEWEA